MELRFEIVFHGPFRVSAGATARGMDAPVNIEHPLPASSLKGLMRAQGAEVLDVRADVIDEVFGSRFAPSPWTWGDAVLSTTGELDFRVEGTTKIRVDDRGRTKRGFLRFSEVVWAESGWFTVEQIAPVAPNRLSSHLAVLHATATSVTSLGESRLRGNGWVTINGVVPDGFWETIGQVRA